MTQPPPRLLDDPSTDETMRGALEAGRAELPSEAQLDALAARLGPLLGPGGGGGPPADPSPALGGGGSAAAKAIAGLGLAAAGVAAVLFVATPDDPRPPRPPPVEAPVIEAPVVEPPVPLGVDVPEDVVEDPPAEPTPVPSRPRQYETDPAAELALIRRSQDALRSDPGAALALTREHERRFGPGTLAQEREVVAIDALHRLGRDPEARTRAAAFRRQWPRSAHLRRLEVLLEP
ncbi:MAG: hypothetical protein H6719_10990 [Sandaracinaceae bacterium]|nr:hypothetical protein [Sandaracinaceae bacterium]